MTIEFEEILWYGKRAKAAYDSEENIRGQFPSTTVVRTLNSIDVQYFVESIPDKNAQLISVRGTANLANAKEDADFIKIEDKRLNIRVHSGFDRDAQAIYRDLLPHLDKTQQVLITGHSLGAAISTLLMMYLHAEGYSIGRSINFGQPKVTNEEGVKKYNFLPLLRVVDNKDVVPLVPPVNFVDFFHGVYEHFGKELLLLNEKYYVLLDEKKSEKKSVGSFWHNIGDEDIPDHFIDNYLKRIEVKLNGAERVNYSERHKYE